VILYQFLSPVRTVRNIKISQYGGQRKGMMSTANVENCRAGWDVKLNELFLILKAIFISWPLGARSIANDIKSQLTKLVTKKVHYIIECHFRPLLSIVMSLLVANSKSVHSAVS